MAKPKDLKYEEEMLRKRLELVRSLKAALRDSESVAAVTVDAYASIIDDLIKEIALEVHRSVKTGLDNLSDIKRKTVVCTPPSPKRTRSLGQSPTQDNRDKTVGTNKKLAPQHQPSGAARGQIMDVFGNPIQPVALEPITCPNCTRKIAAGRFAPHLDKCTGRGRQARRTAQQRLSAIHPSDF